MAEFLAKLKLTYCDDCDIKYSICNTTTEYCKKDMIKAYEQGRADAEKELQEQIPKWHIVADGDLPKENEIVLCVEKDTHIHYLGWYEKFEDEDFSRWSDTECFSMDVIAWMELPKFKGEE